MNALARIGEFSYKIDWRGHSPWPGAHRSRQLGSGTEYFGSRPLTTQNDVRRIDARASMADPFERVWIREMTQRDAIVVWAVVDVSASMIAAGSAWSRVREMVASIALSAVRNGDQFGLVCADDTLRDDLMIPATRRRGAASDAYAVLAPGCVRPRATAHALTRAADRLGVRRGLVFLISDFHVPTMQIEAAMIALSVHDVVPVMVATHAQEGASDAMLSSQWTVFTDAETGAQRTLLMRPSLAAQIHTRERDRHAQIKALASKHARPLFELTDINHHFDPALLTRYFLQGSLLAH